MKWLSIICIAIVIVVGVLEIIAIHFNWKKWVQYTAAVISMLGVLGAGVPSIISQINVADTINNTVYYMPDADYESLFKNGSVLTDSINPHNTQTLRSISKYDPIDYPSDEVTAAIVDKRTDVFFYNEAFYLDLMVRNVTKGEKNFSYYTKADVGDIVEFQSEFINSSDRTMNDVMVKAWLPMNADYIEGTTKLFNGSNPDGITSVYDSIAKDGENIGGYNMNANAYIRFRLQMKDLNLVSGKNRIVTWLGAQSGTGGMMLKSADVYINKD